MANGYGLLGIDPVHNRLVPQPRNPYVYYIFTVDEPNELNADETTSNDRDPQMDWTIRRLTWDWTMVLETSLRPKKRTPCHLQ
jgi:hypothetical protein